MKYRILLFSIFFLAFFLRYSLLTQVPPSLHGDEMGVSYNAYSLLKTGKDEYGRFLPLTFRNDLTPVDVYLTIPWIALFGLTEFSSRIHAVFTGLLTIGASFTLVRLLASRKTALLTIFLLAILPWHIHTSRIGLGVNSGLFLQISGVVFFLTALHGSKWRLVLSFLSFGLSTYAYHAPKLTAPLLLIILFILYRRPFLQRIKIFTFVLLSLVFILLPTILYLFVRPIRETRFGGINVLLIRNSARPLLGSTLFWQIPITIAMNYLSHFDPQLLFWDSRKLKYFQIPDIGMFHAWEMPFMIVGVFILLISWREKNSQLILAWLLIAPAASSLTIGGQLAHVNRVMLFLPMLPLASAIGITRVAKFLFQRNKHLAVFFLSVFSVYVVWSLVFFLNQYVKHLSTDFAEFWGTHVRDAVVSLTPFESTADRIVMTNYPASYAQTYMYMLFYGKKEPSWLQTVPKVRNSTIGYSAMGKYEFRPIKWSEDKNLKNAIIVGRPDDIPQTTNVVKEIYLPSGKLVLRIVKTY